MRRFAWLALVALALPLAACDDRRNDTAEERVDEAAEDARETAEEAGEAVEEGARDLRDFTFDQRDDFRAAVREDIREIDDEIAELGRDTRGAAGAVSEEAMANIRSARQALDRSLERVGDAAEDNWAEVRSGVEDALRNLRQSIADVRATSGPMGGRSAGQT